MKLKLNYETKYLCSQIERVIGRRYNIRPDLQPDVMPEVTGYMYRETITGFFRAWKINEIHFRIMNIVNELRIADNEIILKNTGMEKDEFQKYLYQCVVYGLLCENNIFFKNGKKLHLYMVDTGGIFALEEAGKNYIKIPYTIGIDERLNIYRKNIALSEKGVITGETAKIVFLEKTIGSNIEKNSIVLMDSEIAEELGAKSDLDMLLKQVVVPYNLRVFDISSKTFIDNIYR